MGLQDWETRDHLALEILPRRYHPMVSYESLVENRSTETLLDMREQLRHHGLWKKHWLYLGSSTQVLSCLQKNSIVVICLSHDQGRTVEATHETFWWITKGDQVLLGRDRLIPDRHGALNFLVLELKSISRTVSHSELS